MLAFVGGAPGTGKSWLAGSVAEYIDPAEVLLVATLAREVNSFSYQRYDLDSVVVGSLAELSSLIRYLRTDTQYRAVVIDNGTEMSDFVWRASLKAYNVEDISQLPRGNSLSPYATNLDKMSQLFCDLSMLTGKYGSVGKPKSIIIPWHVQPIKESVTDQESADERGQGIEYGGQFLPAVRGAFRRRVGALVDIMVYTNIVSVRADGDPLAPKESRYAVQVLSDRDLHCKMPGNPLDPDKLLLGKYLDIHKANDGWRKLMELIK